MQALRICLGATIALGIAGAHAGAPRSKAARAEFVRDTPCPSTGRSSGSCPGYVVDHVVPLCAGGADSAINMQWQDVAAARLKDRSERAACRKARLGATRPNPDEKK